MQKDAYTLILEAIEAGVNKPGDRLVESELAERLGVSRTPVREALQREKVDSVVTVRPTGTHSWEYWQRDLHDTWPALKRDLAG